MSESVYKWSCHFGRSGDLQGLFVAADEVVESALGQIALFYEALGKHSQPRTTLSRDQFRLLSDHPQVIEFVKTHGTTGYNPLDYIHLECAVCELYVTEDVLSFVCRTHGVSLCDGCVEKPEHVECETTERECSETWWCDEIA